MNKRRTVFCLVFCLLAGLLCAALGEGGQSLSSGGYSYTVLPDGTAAVTGYPVEDGIVTIPAELDGIPVTAVGPADPAGGEARQQIRKIVVSEGVRVLEPDAFSGLPQLVYVTLPDSLAEIGAGAFRGCGKLTSVTLSRQLKVIGEEAFAGCALDSVSFPEGLEAIGARAFDSSVFRELTFPASLAVIGREAFRAEEAQRLKRVTFLGADTEIGPRAFGFTYPGDGKTMGSYTELLPSSVKVPTLTVICEPGSRPDEQLLFNVKKRYPEWDSTHVRTAPAEKEIGPGLYTAEDRVYELIIPEGVEVIGDDAFAGLKTLNKLTLPSTLRSIGKNAFSGCFALEAVEFPKGLTALGEACFMDCLSLKSVTVPEGVTEIPDRAFENCFKLETLKLPNGLKSIGARAFARDSEIVTFVYDTFEAKDHFSALKELKIPAGVEVIGAEAFAGNDGLTKIAFAKEPRLRELKERAFADCTRLKKLVLPEGLESIGDEAFKNDHALMSLTVPDSVTEVGRSVMEGCPVQIEVICAPGSVMAEHMETYQR